MISATYLFDDCGKLADEFVWEQRVAEVLSTRLPVIAELPSSTFREWRDVEGKGRYGNGSVPAKSKDLVRTETLHSSRTASLVKVLTAEGIPWCACSPIARNGLSHFVLDEWNDIMIRMGVKTVTGTGQSSSIAFIRQI